MSSTAALITTWASSMVVSSRASRPRTDRQGSSGPGRSPASSGRAVPATASSGAAVRMSPNAAADRTPAAPRPTAKITRSPPSAASWRP